MSDIDQDRFNEVCNDTVRLVGEVTGASFTESVRAFERLMDEEYGVDDDAVMSADDIVQAIAEGIQHHHPEMAPREVERLATRAVDKIRDLLLPPPNLKLLKDE